MAQWQRVTANKFILTFSWAAVLRASSEVSEAIWIAPAATVNKGLALHGGHVEEVEPEEGTTGSHLFGIPADLGNFWGERDDKIWDLDYIRVFVQFMHKKNKLKQTLIIYYIVS